MSRKLPPEYLDFAKYKKELYQVKELQHFQLRRRAVSGTYRSQTLKGTILELRVDVDRRRPQNRVSGDFFTIGPFLVHKGITIIAGIKESYLGSFVVENLTVTMSDTAAVMSGPVKFYDDLTNTRYTIEVKIPRVSFFTSPPDATVNFFTSGNLTHSFVCPKISEYFRTVKLEIDMIQGTAFPPAAQTCTDPHPSDLFCEDITTQICYQRAGIGMTVKEDDVLNDIDSDADTAWDWAELHDLMELRFDLFANVLQWNLYGVVVHEFEDPGVAGIMFDWLGGQPGDSFFRQGAAIAYDKIVAAGGTATAAENRDLLWTLVHELGHAFNLPHTWLRQDSPDSASLSFMNYTSGYTGGAGGTNAYWSDFRWEFDDVELAWMRHADRNSVIFGGTNWIWNNLCNLTDPELEIGKAALNLEIRGNEIYDYAQPVQLELKLKNISDTSLNVLNLLEPEDEWMTIYIMRPDGHSIRYHPPVRRTRIPEEVALAPGQAIYQSVLLSFSPKGPVFSLPGEYKIRAHYNMANKALVVSPNYRLRVATPKSQKTEELAHLVFSNEASKFLYYGGSERHPETTKRLMEAAKKYKDSDPSVVPHINLALGKHQSRPFKKLIQKGDKRVITERSANLKEAVAHLEAAWKLPASGVSTLDNITYNRLSTLLANTYRKQKQNKNAQRVLQESFEYFKKRKVVTPVLKEYEKRIAAYGKNG